MANFIGIRRKGRKRIGHKSALTSFKSKMLHRVCYDLVITFIIAFTVTLQSRASGRQKITVIIPCDPESMLSVLEDTLGVLLHC